jgi:hypothetical protein
MAGTDGCPAGGDLLRAAACMRSAGGDVVLLDEVSRQRFKFERGVVVCVCVCACVTLCVVARRHGPASGSWTEALNKMLVRATV